MNKTSATDGRRTVDHIMTVSKYRGVMAMVGSNLGCGCAPLGPVHDRVFVKFTCNRSDYFKRLSTRLHERQLIRWLERMLAKHSLSCE
jgi:hypothetical protein